MNLVYLAPQWFFGFDIFLELVFAFVTLFVAISAFRVYRLSAIRECEVFGIAFSFISASYFIWPVMNFLFLSPQGNGINVCRIANTYALAGFVFYFHSLLFLIGVGTLTFLTLGVKGPRKYSLFVSLVLLSVLFAAKMAVAFYFVSALLLFYLVLHFYSEYNRTGRQTTLMVLSAFLLLFLAKVGFVFASVHQAPYVLGHLLELVAYSIILFSLIKLMR